MTFIAEIPVVFRGFGLVRQRRPEKKVNGGYNRKLGQFNVAGSTLDLHRDSLHYVMANDFEQKGLIMSLKESS